MRVYIIGAQASGWANSGGLDRSSIAIIRAE
jgi:hypothetical protein